MKKILLLIIMIPAFAFSQKGFYIGAHANTGPFMLYNYNDWHANAHSIQPIADNMFKLHDFQTGVKIEEGLSNKFLIAFDLNYSQYQQNYRRNLRTGDISPPVWYNHFSILNYASISANCIFNLADASASNLVPYLSAGIHGSYLLKFYEEGNSDLYLGGTSHNVNNNGKSNGYFAQNGVITFLPNTTTDCIYNKINYGINAEMGIKAEVSKKITIGLEVSGLYDLRNTDNLKALVYYGTPYHYWDSSTKIPGSSSGDLSLRKPSHNIYAGLGVSILYRFGRGGYY